MIGGKTSRLKTRRLRLGPTARPSRTTCTYFWRCPAVLGPSLFFFFSSNLSCVSYTLSSCPLAGGKLFFYWLSSVRCVLRLQTELNVRTSPELRRKRKRVNKVKHITVWNWVAMETRIFKLCKYCMEEISRASWRIEWVTREQTLGKEMFVNLLFVPNRGFVMLIFDKNKCAQTVWFTPIYYTLWPSTKYSWTMQFITDHHLSLG